MDGIYLAVKIVLAFLGCAGFLVLLGVAALVVLVQRNPPEEW